MNSSIKFLCQICYKKVLISLLTGNYLHEVFDKKKNIIMQINEIYQTIRINLRISLQKFGNFVTNQKKKFEKNSVFYFQEEKQDISCLMYSKYSNFEKIYKAYSFKLSKTNLIKVLLRTVFLFSVFKRYYTSLRFFSSFNKIIIIYPWEINCSLHFILYVLYNCM